jgi:hypothetical protein
MQKNQVSFYPFGYLHVSKSDGFLKFENLKSDYISSFL